MKNYENRKWSESIRQDHSEYYKMARYKETKPTPMQMAYSLSKLKEEMQRLELEYKRKSAELIAAIGDQKRVDFYKDGVSYTAKLVEGTRTVVDEEALKNLIPEDVWDSILTSKVDQNKLSQAITSGEISAEEVSEAVSIVPSSPYWKFTEVKRHDEPANP